MLCCMNKWVRVGVGVFIIRNGKILMGKRKNAHGDGTWSIPGGHLEYGESFEQTAKREVAEETGLHVTNIRFGGLTNDVFSAENKHYVTIWMLSDYTSGEEQIMEPDKFIAMSWHSLDALPQPLFLPWEQLLQSSFFKEIKKAVQESISKD